MLRRTLLGLSAGLGINWLSGCSRKPPVPRRTLRVSAGPYLYLAPFYLANELGYFAEAGFDIEIQRYAVSYQSIPLLSGGKVDVMISPPSGALVNAFARGARIKVVAGQDNAVPGCSEIGRIYGHRRSFPRGLADLRELKGKQVAIVSKAGLMEFCLDAMVALAGLKAGEIQTTVLPRPEAISAVVAGKLDAFLASDHFDKERIAGSPELVRGAALAAVLPDFQYTYILFGQRLLRDDPAIGAGFLSAQLRGVRAYLDGKTPQFVQDFAESNGLDPKLARESCRKTVSPDGAIHLEDLQRFVDWTVYKQYCLMSVRASQFVDRRFLQQVRGTGSFRESCWPARSYGRVRNS